MARKARERLGEDVTLYGCPYWVNNTEPLPVLSFILFLLYTVYSTSFVLNVVKYDSRGVVNQSIHWHIHISLGLELEEDSNLKLIHV